MSDLSAPVTARTFTHDPLCPRWTTGACYCDLIREAQRGERKRIGDAIAARARGWRSMWAQSEGMTVTADTVLGAYTHAEQIARGVE